MGYITSIYRKIRKAGRVLRDAMSKSKAPPAELEKIVPHGGKEKFHKIVNDMIDEYGFDIPNAKKYASRVLEMDEADRSTTDKDIIEVYSP